MIRWMFHFALTLSLAVWVGAIVFFSTVVTPTIFLVLPRSQAGSLVARLFPPYYFTGAVCGLAALGAALLLFLFESGSRFVRALQVALILLMLAGNVTAGTVLRGRLDSLRLERFGILTDADRAAVEKRFQKLHRRSVMLNGAVLALGVAGLGTLAIRKKKG